MFSSLKNKIRWHHFLYGCVGVLIIIPLAPIICRFLPPVMVGEYNIDLIVAFIGTVAIVRVLMWLVRPMLIPLVVLVIAYVGYLQVKGAYTYHDIIDDYKSQVRQNWKIKEEKESDMLNANPAFFDNIQSRTARLVKAKIHPTDSLVRNFAIAHSLDYFGEYKPKYGQLARYLSLFKYINQNFKYVPDPERDEYYATARETILNGLGGDCDDHSILMATCMESIGATCRLVVIKDHMYPELYVGDKEKFFIIQKAILQMFDNYAIDRIYYHESKGEYWINLDYTAHYPGGRYLNDNVKLVIDL